MKYNTKLNKRFLNPITAYSTWFIVIIITAISLFSDYGTANAGLVSFMNSIIGGESVSAKTSQTPMIINSQNIPLLQAAINTDPNPNKPAELIPIQGNVLVADVAMSGALESDDMANTSISTYIVREGDTLSGIAKMFNVSVSTIVWANNLGGSKSVLKVGQTLVILPVSGVKYTVSKGDTIGGIVKKYKADMNEVLHYNDLSQGSVLIEGQTIIIPDVELSMPSGSLSGDSSSLPKYSGYYIRPIVGGYRSQGLHGHNGIDLAAPLGTPIHAAADGVVIISLSDGGWHGGYGNYIVVSHSNGTQTLYAHITRSVTRVGERVSQGDTIGYVGSTGKSTGPHLHFEIRGARNPF